jgi:hypothetical protein
MVELVQTVEMFFLNLGKTGWSYGVLSAYSNMIPMIVFLFTSIYRTLLYINHYCEHLYEQGQLTPLPQVNGLHLPGTV